MLCKQITPWIHWRHFRCSSTGDCRYVSVESGTAPLSKRRTGTCSRTTSRLSRLSPRTSGTPYAEQRSFQKSQQILQFPSTQIIQNTIYFQLGLYGSPLHAREHGQTFLWEAFNIETNAFRGIPRRDEEEGSGLLRPSPCRGHMRDVWHEGQGHHQTLAGHQGNKESGF